MRNIALDVEARIPGYDFLYVSADLSKLSLYARIKLALLVRKTLLWLWYHGLPKYRPVSLRDIF